MHSPDGTVYTLDVHRLVYSGKHKYNSRYKAYILASKVEDRFGNTVNYSYDGRARLTGITALDGRTIDIQYNYDVTGSTHRHLISDIVVNGRTWQYIYDGQDTPNDTSDDSDTLVSVIRPDNKAWQFDLGLLSTFKPRSTLDANQAKDICKRYTTDRQITASISHPNGVVGQFTFTETLHGRANVDRELDNADVPKDYINKCFRAFSLTNKALTIPTTTPNQTQNYNWTYSYSNIEGYYGYDLNNQTSLPKPLPSDSAIVVALTQPHLTEFNFDPIMYRRTSVTGPDNAKTVYYHNRNYKSNLDGRLVLINHFDTDGTTLLKATVNQYEDDLAKVPAAGLSHVTFDNRLPHVTPSRTLQTSEFVFSSDSFTQFTTQYSAFNDYHIPTQINELQKDAIGNTVNSRYIKKTYQHHYDTQYTNYWLLNIPMQTEIGSYNIDTLSIDYTTVKSIEYHPASEGRAYVWQPNHVYSYGRLARTYSAYHNDGNLQKVEFNAKLKDENGNLGSHNQYIQYNNYKRGIVGTTTIPLRYTTSNTATQSISRTINDNGWITQTKDFNNNQIDYDYDDIGRLKAITPENSNIAGTHISWDNSGLIQTSTRCTMSNHQCITGTDLLTVERHFDGLYRELSITTTDVKSSIAETAIIKQHNSYNAYNKVTFASIPFYVTGADKTTTTSVAGMSTSYDGLQRTKTKIEIDLAQQQYPTSLSYLLGNRVQITNPRGYTTTTTYLAYGQPSQQQATYIDSPEGLSTAIDINALGNITSITQSGLYNGANISFTEKRAYNSENQLCRTHRRDVGDSYFEYHDNGQLQWQATIEAQAHTSELTCGNSSAINANLKTNLTYDNHGKIRNINYGDTTPNVQYTYNKSGDLTKLVAGSTIQDYGYNTLRQLTSEKLSLTAHNQAWTFGYQYDLMGHQKNITYPSANIGTIALAPNAFGQVTKAHGPQGALYAYDARYYANGLLDSFTYGNGISHKTTLNDRGIPQNITDSLNTSKIIDLSYTYDNNKNINSIINGVDSQHSLNDIVYDALDRLRATKNDSNNIVTSLTYDPLGNITTHNTQTSELTYQYNRQTNRLTAVTDAKNVHSYNFNGGYDARGNVTNNDNRTFSYNLANQMTGSNNNASSYIYDGHNRRVIENHSNGSTSYSFYSKAGRVGTKTTFLF